MPIYTADEVAKEMLGHCDATSLTEVDMNIVDAAISRADDAIYAFLLRETGYQAHTEVITPIDQNDPTLLLDPTLENVRRSALNLTNTPVLASGIQVWENDSKQTDFSASHLLTDGTDYQLENVVDGFSGSGVLRRLGSRTWPTAPGGVKVTYTCGLDITNAPNQWGMIRLAAYYAIQTSLQRTKAFGHFFNSSTPGMLKAEELGKYSREYDNSSVNEILQNNVNSCGLPPEAVWALEPLISYEGYL